MHRSCQGTKHFFKERPLCFKCLHSLCTAAGKSTFVRLLEQESADWEVVPEPIARWCNVQTKGSDFEVQTHITALFYFKSFSDILQNLKVNRLLYSASSYKQKTTEARSLQSRINCGCFAADLLRDVEV